MSDNQITPRIVPGVLFRSWSPLYQAIAKEFVKEGKWIIEGDTNANNN